MAKQSGGISLVAIGLLGAVVYLGAKFATIPFAETPYAVRLRAYITNAYAKGQNVYFTIRFENPNTNSLVVRSIVGDVYMNKLKVGTVAHFGNDIIKGNAQSSIDLEVTLKVANLLLNLLDVLAAKTQTQLLTFSGTVNINGSPVNINESIFL